jgi:hypothetical protein
MLRGPMRGREHRGGAPSIREEGLVMELDVGPKELRRVFSPGSRREEAPAWIEQKAFDIPRQAIVR